MEQATFIPFLDNTIKFLYCTAIAYVEVSSCFRRGLLLSGRISSPR